jgi:hypothetical protein
MSSQLMRDTADVLEKVAAYIDQDVQARHEAVQAERLRIATELREKVATATGEDLPAEVIDKIASADPSVVDAFTKLAERQYNEPPEEMGAGQNLGDDDNAVPLTKTAQQAEAVDRQGEAFVDWVMS